MIVHGLINYLLKVGEEVIEGRPCKLQTNEKIRSHEQSINAVMVAIKPGIFDILFTKFDEKMIRNYLIKIKMAQFTLRDNQADQISEKKTKVT